jgi:hypothetical protein
MTNINKIIEIIYVKIFKELKYINIELNLIY